MAAVVYVIKVKNRKTWRITDVPSCFIFTDTAECVKTRLWTRVFAIEQHPVKPHIVKKLAILLLLRKFDFINGNRRIAHKI